MHYIDQFKLKAKQAKRARGGKVIISMDEVAGLISEIEMLEQHIEQASDVDVVEKDEDETIYVSMEGGMFK